MILSGNAAKLARRAQLVARDTPEELLDELTAAVGLAGHPFYHGGLHGGQLHHGDNSTLKELPDAFTMDVAHGDAACAALRTYHTHVCNGAPETKVGREAALKRGWTGPQQSLALAGHHQASTRMCNLAITVHGAGEPVAILAMSLSANAHDCSVQAIHAAPKVRGLRVPEPMWTRAKTVVAERARAQSRRVSVRFSLELPCCQSQQGANFWITRMGWDGTPHAKEAADAWGRGIKWESGTYELWYKLEV